MRILALGCTCLCLTFGILFEPIEAQSKEATRKFVELQAAMQMHIERQLVDGALLHLDLESGAIEEYYPSQAHAIIMQTKDYYILCSDLKNIDGKSVPIDFYMVEDNGHFVVIRREINNRTPLKNLMDNGVVSRLK